MAQTYRITIQHEDAEQTIEVSEDQTILAAALEAGIDLPNSCNAGVCTTCAAKLATGTTVQEDAMGLGPELRDQGFALLCVAYPRSDIQLESSQEDAVYGLQFGQS